MLVEQTIIRKDSSDWLTCCCGSIYRIVIFISSDCFAIYLPNKVVSRYNTILFIAISVPIDTEVMLMSLFASSFFLIAFKNTLTLIVE